MWHNQAELRCFQMFFLDAAILLAATSGSFAAKDFPPGRSGGANRLHKPGGVVSRSGHTLAGIDVLEEEQRGDEPARIVEGWVGELEAFPEVRAKYLLYRREWSIR